MIRDKYLLHIKIVGINLTGHGKKSHQCTYPPSPKTNEWENIVLFG